jgi:methionyl-tRNA synthetase
VNFRLHNAIADGISLVRATNKFFNDTAPWKLAKAGKQDELGGILYACCECLRIVSILLTPIMPSKMKELRDTLGLDGMTLTLKNAQIFFVLEPGTPILLEKPLFPRLEAKKNAVSAEPQTGPGSEDGLLDISEFGKVELRVAEVLAAEKVDGADKLLKLQISLGDTKRQIVAGIAQHYRPEQMVGKRVVVVANLKPAKIRGIESNGMLLAAKDGGTLVVVTPDGEIPPGAKIS